MSRFSIIRLEYNYWNGFMFEILGVELSNWRWEGALLGLNIGEDHFNIDLLFFSIEVKKPW